jgi:hypothetical protein
MARALECPACGHRHRLDAIPASATFRCEQCGQALKAPTTVSSHPDAPAPPARATAPPSRAAEPTGRTAASAASAAPAAAGATAAVAPARRPADAPVADRTRSAPVRAAAGVSATVAATPPAENGDAAGRRGRRSQPSAPASAAAPVPRTKVHWYWRLLAWIVAVPLGFLITAWPAYKLGFITKDDLLDIFVGTGIGRYVRLAGVTLAWAIVTALLVQLFVEGGRMRANRKRRQQASAAVPSS